MNFLKFLKLKFIPKVSSIIGTGFSKKYLLYTNITISMTLSGAGDVLEQNYEMLMEELENWDRVRTRNMSISGITVGIVTHHWYKCLDRYLPGYTMRTVMKKIFLDQVLCSPVVIAVFFATLGVLERRTCDEVVRETRQKAWMLYAAEWVVWPPAQFINFYFLPPKYRVLYDNTVSLGYDVYISYVKNSIPVDDKQESNEKQES